MKVGSAFEIPVTLIVQIGAWRSEFGTEYMYTSNLPSDDLIYRNLPIESLSRMLHSADMTFAILLYHIFV